LTSIVFQSPAAASYETEEGNENIGRGLLTLYEDHSVVFFRKKLLRGYEENYSYDLSDIINIKGYDNGFTAEVYYGATEETPSYVTTYFYEIENEEEIDKWVELLTPKKTEKAAPQPIASAQQNIPVFMKEIKEKETIREVVMIRCPHCRTKYEETQNRCPHCGAAPP